jgi:hypothetical protein
MPPRGHFHERIVLGRGRGHDNFACSMSAGGEGGEQACEQAADSERAGRRANSEQACEQSWEQAGEQAGERSGDQAGEHAANTQVTFNWSNATSAGERELTR